MKKGLLLASAVLLLGAGCTPPPQQVQQTTQANVQMNQPVVQGNAMASSSDDAMMQPDGAFTLESDTTVSYVVQKEWFGKPSETVVGTSSDVQGAVDYDADAERLNAVDIMLKTDTLDSGSENRDEDVVGMLGEEISIRLANSVDGIAPGTVSVTIPLDVTINGQTHTVDFDVTGTVSDTMIDVSGTGEANMNDFGIDAPSILNLYSVAEEMNLNFELKASK